jgi:hypothetical protein
LGQAGSTISPALSVTAQVRPELFHRLSLDQGGTISCELSSRAVAFLGKLESRGLVAREPDPTDRRAKIVQLVPDAQPTLEQVLAITRNVQERAMQDFDREESEMLRTLLKRMRANIAGSAPGRGQE